MGNAKTPLSESSNGREIMPMLLVPARRSRIPLPEPPERTSTFIPGYSASKRRAISVTSGAMVLDPVMSSFPAEADFEALPCAEDGGEHHGNSMPSATAIPRLSILLRRQANVMVMRPPLRVFREE